MRKQRLLLACIVVATLAALAGSVYAWPRSDSTTLPPTVTVIVDHWGGTTPTATPANEPPAAYLRSAEGREVRGGLGSYCWSNLCADTFAPISNVDAFFLVVEQGYSVHFDGAAPSTSSEQWIRVEAGGGRVTGNGRAWDSVPPVGVAARPAEAGLYLLLIQAFWVGGRDASYAFYVQVL